MTQTLTEIPDAGLLVGYDGLNRRFLRISDQRLPVSDDRAFFEVYEQGKPQDTLVAIAQYDGTHSCLRVRKWEAAIPDAVTHQVNDEGLPTVNFGRTYFALKGDQKTLIDRINY